MSAAEMPLSIDLNIDRMRAVITKEMAEACKPFMKRLEQLDHVEAFLKAEQRALESPQKRGWLNRKTRRKVRIVRDQSTRDQRKLNKLLPSGSSAGIYAHVAQGVAIVDAVTKEPGLEPHGVAERLVAGGYPFRGTKPLDAIYVAMRHQVIKGTIRQVMPSDEERKQGKHITYYPTKVSASERSLAAPKRLKIEAFRN